MWGLKNSDGTSMKDGSVWDVLCRLSEQSLPFMVPEWDRFGDQGGLTSFKKAELVIYLLVNISFYSYNIYNSKK